MSIATLTIDMGAITANWQALDAMTRAETAAVVKADAYGLGLVPIARALARVGARTFFVALAEEGAVLRQALGLGPTINVFSGHMAGDAQILGQHALTPMVNSIDQLIRHVEALPGHPFGVQLDTGMNRLGMEPAEWTAVRDIAMLQKPSLIMSHLACADDPSHPMNRQQLAAFRRMTADTGLKMSLANTGGILMGEEYHFDLVRPGIGLYGGEPYTNARRVVGISVPVIQSRDLAEGETVGYGNSVTATQPMRIATISAGYADGLHRALGNRAAVFVSGKPCPVIGRVSMDMIAIDITGLTGEPSAVEVLGPHQSIDQLAQNADTIGYEILTSLGPRYARHYTGK